jgi:hypothetical protein
MAHQDLRRATAAAEANKRSPRPDEFENLWRKRQYENAERNPAVTRC